MENEIKIKNNNNKEPKGKIGFAILLVLVGSILLAFNLEMIPAVYRPILISWQMLLITIGILSLSKRHFIHGTILICVGVFFILPIIGQNFPDLLNGTLDNTQNYWPVLLIIGGILFLFTKNDHGICRKYCYPKKFVSDIKEFTNSNTETGNDYVDKAVLFNGSQEIVFSSNFKGGEANAAFGEIKLDLRKVSGLNKSNKLEVNAMFGSIIVYVPSEWQINLKSSAMFGDVQDKRHVIDIPITENTSFLNLKAACMFGSIEIRN